MTKCTAGCGRETGPTTVNTPVPAVKDRMEKGECWYCAVGVPVGEKARGGEAPPEEKAKA